ncbi:MAG: GNAT family N-acetyltransferase [Spirochaetes bacterium]|nr:GNAT family N-acetyltransferase [Spirochaetota bacterium]
MSNILIRKLAKGDGIAVRNITASISQNPIEINYEKVVEEEAANPYDGSFVAVIDDKVVGYIMSHVLTAVFGMEKSAWITMIGVDPKYMDQGIGKRLAMETFSYYKEMGIYTIFTTVRWDSTDLLSYFKILGFDRSSYINLSKTIS